MNIRNGLLIVLALSILGCAQFRLAPLAEQLVEARDAGVEIPLLSKEYPEITLAQAYNIQRGFVRRTIGYLPGSVAGYKGGLTSRRAWERYGLDSPVTGVLPAKGLLSSSSVLAMSDFWRPMVELELAFTFSQTIRYPVENVNEIKSLVSSVAPALEIPDLSFQDLSDLTAPDLVAANVSASHFVIGSPRDFHALDLNDLSLSLYLDDTLVTKGKGNAVMADQWDAVLWLTNELIRQGKVIRKGDILLTGVVGKMTPMQAGVYRADFGALGELMLTVK